VAGKSTALRLFTHSDDIVISEYVTMMESTNGPSIVVKIPGKQLPIVGTYYIKTKIFVLILGSLYLLAKVNIYCYASVAFTLLRKCS
jgi:hypothetical protein